MKLDQLLKSLEITLKDRTIKAVRYSNGNKVEIFLDDWAADGIAETGFYNEQQGEF
jgi:hypothetical protein